MITVRGRAVMGGDLKPLRFDTEAEAVQRIVEMVIAAQHDPIYLNNLSPMLESRAREHGLVE